jgi:glycosyltransferase involved in cell wall biosynthesis
MDAHRPRVSIGLPVYNGANYLAEAIEAILAQTFTDIELIISDNASTDATPAIIEKYMAQDSRVRSYRHPVNVGIASNFEKTLELARGDYFRYHSHDDLCTPTSLEVCVKVLDAHADVVLAFPETEYIEEKGQVVVFEWDDDLIIESNDPVIRFGRYIDLIWIDKNGTQKQNILFGLMRTSLLREVGIGRNVGSDMVMLGALAIRGKIVKALGGKFQRRDHPQQSIHASKTIYRLCVINAPERRGTVILPRLENLFELFHCVTRSPMTTMQKYRSYFHVTRYALTPRWFLRAGKDLLMGAGYLIKRTFKHSKPRQSVGVQR